MRNDGPRPGLVHHLGLRIVTRPQRICGRAGETRDRAKHEPTRDPDDNASCESFYHHSSSSEEAKEEYNSSIPQIEEKVTNTMHAGRRELSILTLATATLATGCGGYSPPPKQPPILSPASATVIPGDMQSFTTQGLTSPLTWYVNEVVGGNEIVGSIDGQGNYTAPQSSPLPDSVTIRASDGSQSATANVRFVGPSIPRKLWSAAPVGTMLSTVVVDSTGISISSGASITGSPEIRKDFIVSFDATGIQRWQTPLTNSVVVNDIVSDQVGGAVLVGEIDSPLPVSPWIARVSAGGQLLAQNVCTAPGTFYRIVGHGNDLYVGQNATSTAPANWISHATPDGTGWCSTPVVEVDFTGDLAADDVEFLVSGNLSLAPPPSLQVIGVLSIYDLSGMLKQTWNFGFNPAIGLDTPRIAESQEGTNTFVYVGGDIAQLLGLAKLDMSRAVQPGWPVQWSVANGSSILSEFLTRVLPMPSGGAVTLVQGEGQASLQDRCDIRFYDKSGSLVWQIQDGVEAVWCSSATLTSDGKFLLVAGRIATPPQGLPNPILEKYVLPF